MNKYILAVLTVVASVGLSYVVSHNPMQFGDSIFAFQPDISEGFTQNGTELLDRSKNFKNMLTASSYDVTVSDDLTVGDDVTITGNLSVTTDVTVGGASASTVAVAVIGESTGTSTVIFGSGSGTIADESLCLSWVEGGAGQTKTRVWIVPTGTTPFIERFTSKPAACP